MGFTFKPAIWKNSALYELPRPVRTVRIQDAWDFEDFKVPLADGDSLVGRSQQGVDISLEGQCGTQADALKSTEQEMFEELETLRSKLGVSSPGETYDLFLYHDDVSGLYRHFKSCTTVRFEYDLSDKHLFTYTALVHAEDPVIYTTGPA